MKKSLIKHDDGLALQIDQSLLDALGVDANTSFEITTNGQALVVTPVPSDAHHKHLTKALESVNEQYPETLRKLSE